MNASVILRRAGPDDWAAVAAIHSASWRTAYRGIYPDSYLDEEATEERRRHWRSALAAMDPEIDAVFLAEAGGEAVGFACVRIEAEAAGPLLDNLHVLPERKGEGIGRRLIREAARWLAAKRPEAALQLGVWKDNEAARSFYAHLGGLEVEELILPTEGGGEAAQIRVRWERATDLLARSRTDE
ncbi:MAG TPA: GNAT family N-acetyltransferase [Allosphingosinicella sp.]|nr:GNAT family N-acetyltransferase [Allosphingosinicella sp.]